MFELSKKQDLDGCTQCDACKTQIYHELDEVYHCTAVLSGDFNRHIHLCEDCFAEHVGNIPVIHVRAQ